MKRILIIEDNKETLSNIKNEFKNSDIETICCSDFDSAKKAVENNIPFDAVILDWYFVLEESCDYSLQLLNMLKTKIFIPVFVYTGHLYDFENKTEDDLGYPKNIICGTDKAITAVELKNKIESLTNENLTLKLARNYREKVNQNLEKVFFELNDSENSSLEKIFRIIFGNGDNIDWNNDIILTLLHRHIISDDDFTSKIREILKNLTDSAQNDEDFNRRLLNKIIYHQGESDYIRNGDIVQIKINDSSDVVMCCGIVVTPDCDLENKSCRQIEIVELRQINDTELKLDNGEIKKIKEYNHPSLYYIPSLKIDFDYVDFVAIFKNKLLFNENEVNHNNKYPKASKRPLYSHSYMHNGKQVKIELICSKVNPFKAEFLHKLNTHNSRVGIPDIKKLL